MLKILSFIAICLFSNLATFTLQAYQSAHVIVVSHYGVDKNKQPKKYVLFGLTRDGKLSTFGGLADRGEKNPKDTAAREAEEEALGVIGNQKAIRKRLRGLKPSSGMSSGHLSYVLPGKYFGDNLSRKFKKIRFDKNRKLSHSQKEMVDIVAVRVDKIRSKVLNGDKLIFKDNDGKMRPLRNGVQGAIKAAVRSGHL
jgi:hypothetical protein